MRNKFINSQEVLLVYTRHCDGIRIDESDLLATTYDTAEEVTKLLNDEVVRVVRFDQENLTAEDVTENLAQAYLEAHSLLCSWEAGTLPEYVRESLEWEKLVTDEEDAGPHVPDYIENGTYHTVNGRVA